MFRNASTFDIVWLLLTAGLFCYALSQAWVRRGREWPFRLGFLALTLGLFIGRLRSLPRIAASDAAPRLRWIEAPLAVAALVLIMGAVLTRRTPAGEGRGASKES